MPELSRSFPVIDPNVKHVGVSKLRELNATKLRDLDKTLVIQDDDTPLAVVLSYGRYLDMQEERDNIIATLEALFADDKAAELKAALEQTKSGEITPFSSISRTLRRRGGKEKER